MTQKIWWIERLEGVGCEVPSCMSMWYVMCVCVWMATLGQFHEAMTKLTENIQFLNCCHLWLWKATHCIFLQLGGECAHCDWLWSTNLKCIGVQHSWVTRAGMGQVKLLWTCMSSKVHHSDCSENNRKKGRRIFVTDIFCLFLSCKISEVTKSHQSLLQTVSAVGQVKLVWTYTTQIALKTTEKK